VWIEKNDRAEALIKLKRNEFIAALQDASQDILGTLTLDSSPQSWALKSLEARDIIAPRLALMAEAAHAMSPITAQGLNLSLRDVGALAEIIIDAARAGIDIGAQSILQQYRRRRLLDIQTRVMGVDGMNSLVSTDYNFIKRVRRGGLKAVAGISPLKKFAAHQGLAPDMDAGRLMRGLPL
jgi:2-octaprenyl-6-methoxyphenol hydroxylase